MTRTCSDCSTPISRDSKGRCRACAMREVSLRPEIAKTRRDGLNAKRRDPAFVERHRESCRVAAARIMADPVKAAAKREVGQRTGRHNFWREADEASKVAARDAIRRARLSWCPEQYWDLNAKMKVGGMLLAERKAVILAEIAGTPENAHRAVLNHQDAQRIRHERDVAQSY